MSDMRFIAAEPGDQSEEEVVLLVCACGQVGNSDQWSWPTRCGSYGYGMHNMSTSRCPVRRYRVAAWEELDP